MAAELRLMIPTKESVEPDDRQLVQTIRNGEPEAFEQLVRRKTSKVYSPCYRIFVMREMDDLPSSEIARILGCRESTVRNHLFNARKLMQQQLKKRFPEYSRLWEERA